MKLTKITALAFFTAALIFTSCKKDNANAEEIAITVEAAENQATADNTDEDVIDLTEEAAARGNVLLDVPSGNNQPINNNYLGQCVIVTVTGSFPAKNIKIDFGTGCTDRFGNTRKGVINVVLTNFLFTPNAVATITFDNYFINNIKREGTITYTNKSTLGNPNKVWQRTVTNGKVTMPNGRYWLHTADITYTQTAGALTPNTVLDDVFNITGTRSTTNAAGKTRTATTLTALQKVIACRYITQGTLQLQGTNHTAVLDFGDGTCDNKATISINGRPERNIILPR
jgi:hypothetical protein